MRKIATEWPGANVLVVTHGGVLDSVWRHAKQLPISVRRDHDIHNTSVNVVRVSGDQFELVTWNDVAHL
jgi:probable phosphoglycerate mutase